MRSLLIISALGMMISSLICVEPQINLPDVIITGEHTLKADLPVYDVNLSHYTQTDTTKSFQYAPELLPFELRDPKQHKHEQCGYLNGMGGNKKQIYFDGMYHSLSNPLLNFAADGFQYHLTAFWNQTYARFQWLPEFNSVNSQVAVQSIFIDTPLSDSQTEITGASLGFKQRLDAMFPKFMKETDVSITYVNGQEDAHKLTRIQDYNLFMKTLIPVTTNDLLNIRYENLNQHPQGVLGAYSDRIVQFQRLGLWLGVDKLHLYPSLDLLYMYPIKSLFDVYISNDPYLRNEDIISAFRINPWQHINSLRRSYIQEKAMLNTTVGFEMHSIFHVALSQKVQYRQDLPIYVNIPYTLYDRKLDDCFQQSTNFIIGYGIDKFILQNSLTYNQYKCNSLDINWLPYAGIWKNKAIFTYQSLWGTTECDVNYETIRKDHFGKMLPDSFLINLKQDFQIRRNVSINVKIFNLLDKHYIQFAEIPYQQFNFCIGGTGTF